MDRTAAIRNRLTVPVLAFGGILMAVMQTVVVPLLPDLPRLTGASAGTVSWMVTATLLSGAVLTPVLGRAGDMYGKRRVLMAALALMTLGSVLCALTSDIGVLIAARTLSGAAAAVVPLSISILRDELPPERRGSAVALMSSTVGIGAALGLPLAAVIVQYADWHTMFWVTSALGAAGVTLVWWAVRESPVREPGRFDVPGALGLAVGLVCLLLGVSQGGQWGWGGPRVVGLFLAAAVVLALWWWQQLRAEQPLVDLRLVARPRVGLSHVAALLAGFAFYANTLVTAQLVQAPEATGYGLGLSIVATGLCLLPSGVIMLLLSPVSARISAARGPRVTLALGAAVIAAGYAVRIADSRDLWMIIGGATVVATGTTLAYSALPTLILRAVPAGQTASANGVNVLMRTIGQACSSAAVAAVLVHHTSLVGGAPVPTLHGYLLAFAMAGAVALLAVAAALCIPGDSGSDAPDGPEPAGDRTPGAHDRAMEGA
ncbi:MULTISPECIES: MFS transporter [Streptomyces]|uniref:MFS transporter n=1 Tax=Streptomyces koelreuteriae TaxID=2838015 RepID=A0ABX8G2X4_9ACTN|nr:MULTISPECIES: MFS transporter [Streptomyces]QWB27878.1 MFS transporter [Streptomyces koelreuteriae]UUA10983.1 MFS transporter [Streptomyces koelreuteriae]UUA18589.1 MFS transporter [Streptomyces sp. CRCS-T-1]